MRSWFIAVSAVLLTACGAAPEAGIGSTTEPTSQATSTTSPSPVTTTSSTLAPSTSGPDVEITTTSLPEPDDLIVEIVVEGGEVVGRRRVDVPIGETLTLVVTSDSADEVHVHGYDLYLDLEAGVAGELTFVADVPGIFEVELEGAGLLLIDLQVGG